MCPRRKFLVTPLILNLHTTEAAFRQMLKRFMIALEDSNDDSLCTRTHCQRHVDISYITDENDQIKTWQNINTDGWYTVPVKTSVRIACSCSISSPNSWVDSSSSSTVMWSVQRAIWVAIVTRQISRCSVEGLARATETTRDVSESHWTKWHRRCVAAAVAIYWVNWNIRVVSGVWILPTRTERTFRRSANKEWPTKRLSEICYINFPSSSYLAKW